MSVETIQTAGALIVLAAVAGEAVFLLGWAIVSTVCVLRDRKERVAREAAEEQLRARVLEEMDR